MQLSPRDLIDIIANLRDAPDSILNSPRQIDNSTVVILIRLVFGICVTLERDYTIDHTEDLPPATP